MLSVNGLTKKYSDNTALNEVSFNIAKGEIVALLGANGCGKTTTVNSICGLIDWDDGDITINEKSIKQSSAYKKQIGAVLGGCRNTNWRLRAKQNAEYFARLRGFKGPDLKEKISRLHTALGLDEHENKEILKLSTGNKQKVALLSALSYSPDYVLLDEPTLGLDFQTVDSLKAIIEQEAKQSGQSFLVTSHDLSFIEDICERVIVLDKGNLLFEGNVTSLKQRLYAYELVIEYQKNRLDDSLTASLWNQRSEISHDGQRTIIKYDTPEQVTPFISAIHSHNLSVVELQVNKLSMERAYQTLINTTQEASE